MWKDLPAPIILLDAGIDPHLKLDTGSVFHFFNLNMKRYGVFRHKIGLGLLTKLSMNVHECLEGVSLRMRIIWLDFGTVRIRFTTKSCPSLRDVAFRN